MPKTPARPMQGCRATRSRGAKPRRCWGSASTLRAPRTAGAQGALRPTGPDPIQRVGAVGFSATRWTSTRSRWPASGFGKSRPAATRCTDRSSLATTAGSAARWSTPSTSPTARPRFGPSGTGRSLRRPCRHANRCRAIYGAGASHFRTSRTSATMIVCRASVSRRCNRRVCSGQPSRRSASSSMPMAGFRSSVDRRLGRRVLREVLAWLAAADAGSQHPRELAQATCTFDRDWASGIDQAAVTGSRRERARRFPGRDPFSPRSSRSRGRSAARQDRGDRRARQR